MPTMKLGQISSNQMSDFQQQHFDADMQFREILTNTPLDIKRKLITRLPGMIDEIKANDRGLNGDGNV